MDYNLIEESFNINMFHFKKKKKYSESNGELFISKQLNQYQGEMLPLAYILRLSFNNV